MEKDFVWLDEVQIRTVTADDLPGLEWDGEYAHFRRIYAEAYERSLKGRTLMWMAELQGRVIAQVFIQLNCDRPELANGRNRAYLYGFRVRPDYRGQGLGTRMLNFVEDDLRQRGFDILTLNVARDNLAAQRLYERQGYQVVAPEPGIWSYQDQQGVWQTVEEPAWRMEKNL